MLSQTTSRISLVRAFCALFVAFSVCLLPSYALGQRARHGGASVPSAVSAAFSVEDDSAAAKYRFGEVFVKVPANAYSMTVPLGMSKGGVILIEFPADDPLYSFHEGNAKLAYVNCGQQADGTGGANGARRCSMRFTDALVLQPGEDFIAGKDGAASTTVITVQRASGIVVSFPLFLVNDASRNANNVVVSYDVKNVIALRKKAGLLTQLATPEALAQDGRVPPTSPLLAPNAGGAPATPSASPAPKNAPTQQASGANATPSEGTVEAAPVALTPDEALREKTVAELQRVATRENTPRFSKPVHGLTLALLGGDPPVSDTAIQVIAVRNTLNVPVRLLPDQPDIRIMQAAKKGDAILEQPVPVKHIATTVGDDNVLRPGEVYYFAVAYETPALGVRQSLCASFAHMMASDSPAVLQLTYQLASR